MNATNDTTDFFGEVIYSYTAEEAIEDGILIPNPRRNRFNECDKLTTNLWEKLGQEPGSDPTALCGAIMAIARAIYHSEAGHVFKGDEDRNFFTLPPNDKGLIVWFVRNEQGKLTAMLPEDY